MNQFLLIAAATFGSEDLTCIATGVLIASGRIGFVPGVLACIFGIFVGDLLLYFAGRLVGRPVLRWKPLRRVLTVEKLDQASRWLAERGARVVLASRFTPGLRLPTYVAAGLLKTKFWTFAGYFLAAAVVWTPILVGGTVLLGKAVPRPVFVVLALGGQAAALLPRRRLVGWLRRKTRWEFWPPWLTYLPVIPYLLYLSCKHRSLTVFTEANPGIPSGGFVGESKSEILSKLTRVPEYSVVAGALSPVARVNAAAEFMRALGLDFPVVLKPDVGERGRDVAIARTVQEVDSYLRAARRDTIIQRYVAGPEFGIFYYRYPGEARGRIYSITEKRFPEVVGDGQSSIAELVWNDPRAVCLGDLYLSRLKRNRQEVPKRGERVVLAEIGSHCRGAIFLNAAHLETEALRNAVDSVARTHPGFYFGRFDVRADSVEDLQAGRFAVLELNGVSAEATHIYDPAVSLVEAYRVMYRQWKVVFEIGALNRRAGIGRRAGLVTYSRPRRSSAPV